jgi:exosortase/archaeosortase family protein
MLMNDRNFLRYAAKFLVAFCFLYYGTIAVIGLATPGNHYIPFIDHYFGYYRWLRDSLLYGSKYLSKLLGYTVDIWPPNYLRVRSGKGVMLAYDCLGYGVISFWLAFVFANSSGIKTKLAWMLSGVAALWLINVIRITAFLIAHNHNWPMPLGWDHHTWFNIASYVLIFFLIWFYDKKNTTTNNITSPKLTEATNPDK